MANTFDAPQSRNEAILQNMLGAENELTEPESRIEDLLQQLLEAWENLDPGGGGGGGGSGEDGGYYTPSVSEAGVLSWTASKSGMPSVADANVKGPQGATGATGPQGPQGNPGANGTNGTDGTTFTPAVSSAGVISWTNDGDKQNPTPVDLAAPVIQAVSPAVTTVTGTTPSIALADNTIFSAGTLTSLTVTGSLNEGQIAVIVFTSGSTATQLTVPSAIKMPDSFAVEANRTYEISIMGSRGAVQSWT